MKNLKLLSKKFIITIFTIFISVTGKLYAEEEAKDIWDNEILPFGQYGFNMSHSILYSHISVYTAWLKCHYPTEFMCALLNSEDPNGDKSKEYLQECKRLEIEILPPMINESKRGYSILSHQKASIIHYPSLH